MSDSEEETGAECPRFVAMHAPHVFAQWAVFTRGILPRAGGWEQQTEWWCQVLEEMAATVEQWRRERDRVNR